MSVWARAGNEISAARSGVRRQRVRVSRTRAASLAAACLALPLLGGLTVSGCGSNGTAAADIPGPPMQVVASVQGQVLGPDGQFAARGLDWSWPLRLLVPPAYAQGTCAYYAVGNPQPVQVSQRVSLSRIDPTTAAHGTTDGAQLLAEADTDANGIFNILYAPLSNLEQQCGLLLEVGGGNLLTRAFVLEHDHNDVDPISEAVVRLVLNRLANLQGAQLCTVSVDQLRTLSTVVHDAVCTATGSTVFELNQNVYNEAAQNPNVQAAVLAALPG
jgi:hypothetical protein